MSISLDRFCDWFTLRNHELKCLESGIEALKFHSIAPFESEFLTPLHAGGKVAQKSFALVLLPLRLRKIIHAFDSEQDFFLLSLLHQSHKILKYLQKLEMAPTIPLLEIPACLIKISLIGKKFFRPAFETEPFSLSIHRVANLFYYTMKLAHFCFYPLSPAILPLLATAKEITCLGKNYFGSNSERTLILYLEDKDQRLEGDVSLWG